MSCTRLPMLLGRHGARVSTCRNSFFRASGQAAFSRTRHISASATAGLSKLLQVSEEVSDAVATDKPVVALESTIYTHGFMGRDLVQEHVDLVRSHGGVPAVIGIVDGVPRVGVSPEEIMRMIDDKGTRKVSRRDIAYLVGMVRFLLVIVTV